MNLLERYANIIHGQPLGMYLLISALIAMLCTSIVFIAIAFDFLQYHHHQKSKNKINSWVETGTMVLYFLVFCILMKLPWGKMNIGLPLYRAFCLTLGNMLLIFGCYVNLRGRFILKHNWANQVTIYTGQTFVSSGVYSWVRHPLYASIIWMLMGGSLIYTNYLVLLSVFIIFIPMMIFRAKQEEQLLKEEFTEYANYQLHVGMFFPKLFYHGNL